MYSINVILKCYLNLLTNFKFQIQQKKYMTKYYLNYNGVFVNLTKVMMAS